MRVATYSAYQNTINQLQTRQRSLQTTQEQLTSGKRVSKPSDDPVAAATAERALAAMAKADAQKRALQAARSSTQLSESALSDGGELLQQAREALVGMGNATYTDSERANLADKIKGLRDQLLGVANRTDGSGAYLFGGQGASSPPFVDGATGVTYQGSAGDTLVATESTLSTSIDGQQAWLQAPATNAGDPPLSIFKVLDTAINGLSTPGISSQDVAAAVKTGIGDLDTFNNHLLAVRARAGEALNRMDQLEQRIADSKLASQTEKSNAEDLDMVQAISDFQNQQTGYDAALKAYSLVQRMSLFNYISG